MLVFFCSYGVAQLSADSTLLQPQGGNPEEGVDSGRYRVQPSTSPPPVKKRKARTVSAAEPAPAEQMTLPVSKDLVCTPEDSRDSGPPIDPPSYAEQIKDLFSGIREPMNVYLAQVHPDDNRRNLVEIAIDPGVLYYQSKSEEAYRNFETFAPNMRLKAELWWTPFIGTYGVYGTTFGGDVVDDASQNSHSPTTYETFEGGLDFRKYFGVTRRANSIVFGLHYFDNVFSPPSTDTYRTQTKSFGFGLHFEGRIPSSATYAWLMGAEMDPKVSEAEFGTALGLNSGSTSSSSLYGVHLGGEIKLARTSLLTWKAEVQLEKDQFIGSANLPDPITHTIPSGVSVTQTQSMFSFGYTWAH
jgi:hypothetical protein